MKPLLFLVLLPLSMLAQERNEILSLRVGYGFTSIKFDEAVDPSFLYFGLSFPSNSFRANGPEFGVSKAFNNRMFIDLSFSSFSGEGERAKVDENEHRYTLKGFQIPLTVNYLIRNPTKRLRLNIGGGFQFLKAQMEQYELVYEGTDEMRIQKADFKISEFQFSARPGIQYRIIPNLYAALIYKVSVSTGGRYSDNPSLSLRYSFQRSN
jgi:Outer membrane protein beta-barrel domain